MGTSDFVSAEKELPNYGLAVRYTMRAFTRALAAVASPYGVTAAEFRLLRILGDDVELTQTEVASLAAMDRPYVSALVKRLMARRLVAAAASASDRRRVNIRLTAAGKHLLGRLSRELERVNERAVIGVDVADRRVLLTALERMRRNLELLEESLAATPVAGRSVPVGAARKGRMQKEPLGLLED